MKELQELKVSCLCGAATHRFRVPKSSLPLPAHLCSCDASRRISGSLLTSYVDITNEYNLTKPDVSALTPYRSSAILTRHFCSTCGTHMYLEYAHDGHIEVATGTFQQVESTDAIVDYQAHMWIADTVDGGASQFIAHVNGKPIKRFKHASGSEDLPLEWNAPLLDKEKKGGSEKKSRKVYAHCHCRGVELYIAPPDHSSRLASSPWSDMIFPSATHASSENPENVPWWVVNENHFMAGTCTCSSCRNALGFDIAFWAFIPAANIFLDVECEKPLMQGSPLGSMKIYQSKKDVTRTFCSTCGANVFWDSGERGGLVDVAVGLLDAHSGARAEEILAWWPWSVSFEGLALNRSLVEGLKLGFRDWAARNEGADYVATGDFVT